MSFRRIGQILGLCLFGVFAFSAPLAESDPFPPIEEIQGNVDFWVQVFAEWGVGQAAVHDLEYPELIYEVVDLPGPIKASYTKQQQRYLEDVREGWEDFLESLESKVSRGKKLDEPEETWFDHITETLGPAGLDGAHERVRTQRGLRERFLTGLERSARYEPLIREIFREAGLPEDLAYLPHVESSFQYHAKSSAGAAGLWQFTRSTGRRYMTINSLVDERLDPIAATHGAVQYLMDAYDRLESWPLALTSYNHGVAGMARAKGRYGDDFGRVVREYDGRLFGFASKNFYAEFLAAREIARAPERFFPEGFTPEPLFDVDSVALGARMRPQTLARAYDLTVDELRALNLGWTSRAVSKDLPLPAGLVVWLPRGTGPASPISESAESFHVVRAGDTLSDIARAYGMSLATLRDINGIPRGSSMIRPGQKLLLSSDASALDGVYVVERGDTLSQIAATFGTTTRALRDANGIRAGSNLIHVGQELQVPGSGVVPHVAPRQHVVRRGDTLSEVAQLYRVSVAGLRAANGIPRDRTAIHSGQVLTLPTSARTPEPHREHVVRRGDTLSGVAVRYGIRLVDLLTANTLTTRSTIYPGQTLRIPLH